MKAKSKTFSPSLLLAISAMVLATGATGESQQSNSAAAPTILAAQKNPTPMGHRDHNPKHGGTFFMAMDNAHHLEGVLLPPGKFYVFLYDAHTHPLTAAKVKQAKGEVAWGEADGAPTTPLAVSPDGKTLEAGFPGQLKLPVTVTLRIHFPDTPPNARPELFTFPFSHFEGSLSNIPPSHGTDHAGHDMDHMSM